MSDALAVRHPAKFSAEIIRVMRDSLTKRAEDPDRTYRLLDPFAGVGGIHALDIPNISTVGIELEPEWAAQHARTLIGNALDLQFADNIFDFIATSPAYGNRMADHHKASDGSRRITYTHYLGRDLDDDNAGKLQWGDHYRAFHLQAWTEAIRVLKPGGFFLLNISDHIRKGEIVEVSKWHVSTLVDLGLRITEWTQVETPRMRFGANHEKRVESENVFGFEKR